jgi:glycosyltransferase involved in cell wall biosynthesis
MITIIAYTIDALAPHQSMMVRHLKVHHGDRTRLEIRPIGSGRERLVTLARTVQDALTRREAVLYFSSFASAPFAACALSLGHRRVVYHSQDWIQDQPGLAARAELSAVARAPMVIWNEANRAAEAARRTGRKDPIFVVPTYLPRDYHVALPEASVRADIAARAGVDPERMVAIFAGGSHSPERLSAELVEAHTRLDKDVALVFTGPARLPPGALHPRCVDLCHLPYEAMLTVMASCDIGALLYDHASAFGHRYQQPGRLTEYLRSGLFLIATGFPDAHRLATTSDVCVVVGGYDVDELAAGLSRLVDLIRAEPCARARIRRMCEETMVYEPAADAALCAAAKQLGLL